MLTAAFGDDDDRLVEEQFPLSIEGDDPYAGNRLLARS
jgi:hypothetical protein